MKKILIFGSGAHSKVILSEIIQIKGYRVIGFVDEDAELFAKADAILQLFQN